MGILKTAGTLAAGVVAAGIAVDGNRHLTVTPYAIGCRDLPPAFEGLRIVHLSDLHASCFGKDQQKLLAVIDGLDPDLILITGDLIDRRRTRTDKDMRPALVLLQQLRQRRPTARVDGNHEVRSLVGRRFRLLADRTGVQNVTDRGLVIRKGDDRLVVIGIPDVACFDYDDSAWQQRMHTLCAPYASSFRIALSHRPQYFDRYVGEGLPLVLCGHAHGGQVRLPLIGGLFAPEQGVLPRYTAGVHTIGDTAMVVSRGLGNSGFPFRFGNRPEIVLLTLHRR